MLHTIVVAGPLDVRVRHVRTTAHGMADAPSVGMRLYYSPGACSLAPHIALREAERTFELERVDLRSHRTADGMDYLMINPKGYVPALQLDGVGSMTLTENAAILQFIGDLAPAKKLVPPSGTFARYHLQEWLGFIGSEVHKQFSPLFQPDTPAFTEERLRSKIGDRFGYLNTVLVDRAYLLGETFGVADAYLYAMLRWTERFEIDIQIWPNLDDYYQRITPRPAVQAALVAEGLLETKKLRRSA
jgi:glutathione S-transferase